MERGPSIFSSSAGGGGDEKVRAPERKGERRSGEIDHKLSARFSELVGGGIFICVCFCVVYSFCVRMQGQGVGHHLSSRRISAGALSLAPFDL